METRQTETNTNDLIHASFLPFSLSTSYMVIIPLALTVVFYVAQERP